MKKAALFTALLISINLVFSQEKLPFEKIQIGEPYTVIDALTKKYITSKEKILTIKRSYTRGKYSYTLQTFNSNTLAQEKINVFDDFPKWYQEEGIIKLNDRVFIFYSLWEKSNSKNQLFVREIDVENCSFSAAKLVFEIKGRLTGEDIGFVLTEEGTVNARDKFDFYVSNNNSKLLIQYKKMYDAESDSKNKDLIGLKVFDENIDFLWGKEIKIPFV